MSAMNLITVFLELFSPKNGQFGRNINPKCQFESKNILSTIGLLKPVLLKSKQNVADLCIFVSAVRQL